MSVWSVGSLPDHLHYNTSRREISHDTSKEMRGTFSPPSSGRYELALPVMEEVMTMTCRHYIVVTS